MLPPNSDYHFILLMYPVLVLKSVVISRPFRLILLNLFSRIDKKINFLDKLNRRYHFRLRCESENGFFIVII